MKSVLKWITGYRLALIGLWFAAICVVNPRGNFSLDDDWVYAAAVKHLLLTHQFRLPWCSASLFTEALWGALFCKLFGFSFVTLRFSTLVSSIVGTLAFYEILLMLRTEKRLAFLGTLTFMFTPYFFNLSFTFMTDGFFCSCLLLSLLLLLRNQDTGSRRDLVLGMSLAVIATLTRQIGLCVPVAWGIMKTIDRPKTAKDWAAAWAPAVLCGAALMIYTGSLRMLGELPATYNLQGKFALNALRHPKLLLHSLASAVPEILIYVGLFVMPVAPILWAKARRNGALFPRTVLAVCAVWILGITPLLLKLHKRIPFRGSTLENFRLGNYFDANLPTIPSIIWYALTFVGIIGAFAVFFALIVGLSKTDAAVLPRLEKQRLRFLLFTLIIYFVPVFLVPDYLDRYILPAIPITLLLLFLITNQGSFGDVPSAKRNFAASAALVAGFALFSALGTRDYLTYYRTAWIARQFVVEQGVAPDLAFNVPPWGPAYFDGAYLNDAEMYMDGPVPHGDSGYVVGTSIPPGYAAIKTFPFYITLSLRESSMIVSKKP